MNNTNQAGSLLGWLELNQSAFHYSNHKTIQNTGFKDLKVQVKTSNAAFS